MEFPTVPTTASLEEIVRFLELQQTQLDELSRPTLQHFIMEVLHVEPASIVDSLIVRADGVDWDPGNGPGIYRYDEATTSWQPLEIGVGESEPYVKINSTGTLPTATGLDAIAIGASSDASANFSVAIAADNAIVNSVQIKELRIESSGLISVALTPDYEDLVIAAGDDAIPNKKYVDDAINDGNI